MTATPPPQNLEAEAAVLGAVMVSQEAMELAADILQPEHFYLARNAAIFRATVELHERADPVDIVTIDAELRRLGLLERAGGMEYVASLESGVAIPAHVENYARMVEEAAIRRGMMSTGTRIYALGANPERDLESALDEAESAVLGLGNRRGSDDAVPLSVTVRQAWSEAAERQENPGSASGVETGIYDLDRMTGGLQPGSLVVLGARPSVGKTSLAIQFAEHAAVSGHIPVGVFSLEMSKWEITHRLIASRANVDGNALKLGMLGEPDWARVAGACGLLSEAPMYLDDRAAATSTELRSKVRRLKVRQNIGLVVVDYIQLMHGSGRENRTQDVSEITRALKRLAVELELPVVAVSQLSRASEMRADRRPQLSDLRESGSIEQDADIVLFLYREGMHNSEVRLDVTELIVAKHRSGPVGTIMLRFLASQTRFTNTTKRVAETVQPTLAEVS